MRRLIFTLLVSVAGFAAIVSYDTSDNTTRNRAEVVVELRSN